MISINIDKRRIAFVKDQTSEEKRKLLKEVWYSNSCLKWHICPLRYIPIGADIPDIIYFARDSNISISAFTDVIHIPEVFNRAY